MPTVKSQDPITRGDIVVGLDPTPGCRPAVSWAIDAARSSGRRLVLVRAVDLSVRRSWIVDRMLGEGLTNLFWPAVRTEVERARIEAGPGVDVRGMVLAGRPTAVMTNAARHADQIVVGVRPRTIGSRLVLGSMGHHLLRTAPCPVVLVPLIPAAPELGRSDTERVVAAVGGATGSAAITYAFDTAHLRGLPLVLLHADGQDGKDVARVMSVHLHDVIEEQHVLHPDVQTIPVRVAGDVAAAARENVGPHDLLIVGNREVDLPAPPIVDGVLLPLLRHPHQVLVVVSDRLVAPGPVGGSLVRNTATE